MKKILFNITIHNHMNNNKFIENTWVALHRIHFKCIWKLEPKEKYNNNLYRYIHWIDFVPGRNLVKMDHQKLSATLLIAIKIKIIFSLVFNHF